MSEETEMAKSNVNLKTNTIKVNLLVELKADLDRAILKADFNDAVFKVPCVNRKTNVINAGFSLKK